MRGAPVGLYARVSTRDQQTLLQRLSSQFTLDRA
jgi:hypothetical protein